VKEDKFILPSSDFTSYEEKLSRINGREKNEDVKDSSLQNL
jgi:hypothetical protein